MFLFIQSKLNVYLILLSVLFSFFLSACSTTNSEPTLENGSNKIVYGLSITVSGIDPHINQSTELGVVLRQVYDTLVYRHPDTLDIVPGLASSWDVSDDELSYTFYLRDDVFFHDGEKFNANAVAANIDRIMNPETGSQRARLLLGTLASYQVLDEYTIQLQLSEPYAPLLDGLSQVYTGMASPKALAEYSNLRYQFHQVGTGPFVFDEYLPEDRIVIQRNPEYTWGPEFYQYSSDNLPENAVHIIEYRFFTDDATRAISLENGVAQVMGELPPLDARALNNNNQFTLAPIPIPGQPLQFYFNTQKEPMNQLGLRQALLFGANRSAIVDALYGGFSPVAWGPLSAVTKYYNVNVNNLYAYDPDQARTVLTTLGYEDTNNDGFLDRNGDTLEISILQPPWGQLPEVVQLLQDQWQNLGIRVVIDPVPGFSALVEKVEQNDYDLVAFDTPGLDPAILNERFLSNGSVNWTGYSSAELDNILREAARQNQDALREQLYNQAQIIIMREALILPIRDYVNLNAYTNQLSGIRFDPYGWFPLMNDVLIEK